jgi:rRNA-processing protein EBP2
LARIAVPKKSISFIVLQTVTSSTPTTIEDVDDDLNRELQFYAQSLAAVKEAKRKLKVEGTPFARPNDYFAEMVKSEEHMGRVRQRLVDDAAGKRAATEARKQRDLKKFGKAVQVAKLQERDKAKRETLDQIKDLKRSIWPKCYLYCMLTSLERSNALPTAENEADMFDVGLESEVKRPRTSSGGKPSNRSGVNHKRQSKNEKFGFGGKKKYSKSGDSLSSAGIGLKGKLAPKKRLGKSKRTTKGRP